MNRGPKTITVKDVAEIIASGYKYAYKFETQTWAEAIAALQFTGTRQDAQDLAVSEYYNKPIGAIGQGQVAKALERHVWIVPLLGVIDWIQEVERKRNPVIIFVEGGVVQTVHAPYGQSVIVVDWDNTKYGGDVHQRASGAVDFYDGIGMKGDTLEDYLLSTEGLSGDPLDLYTAINNEILRIINN